MLKILVVDDFEADRENIKCILESLEEINVMVLGVCENGLQALDFIEDTKPDVIISDIEMPFMNGLELAKNINVSYPTIKIIFCSLYDEFEYARKALYLNSYGYILKPIDKSELSKCLINIEDQFETENRLLSEQKEIREAFILSKPQLKENILRELITNLTMEEEQVWKKIEYFDIKFRKGFYILLYVEIDNFKIVTESTKIEQTQLITIKVKEKLESIMRVLGDFPVLRIDDAHFVILLSDSIRDEICEKSMLIAKGIIEEFTFSDISLTISVSNMCDKLKELKTLFEQCQYTMRYKFTLGNGKVLTGEDIPNGEVNSDIDLNTLQKDIKFLLNSGSREEINEYINSLIDNRSVAVSEKYLKNLCFSIVMCIRFVLSQNNESLNHIFNDEILVWEKLMKFETIVDVRNWIENLIIYTREHLSNKSIGKNKPIVDMIKEYLEKNYMKNIGIDHIAYEMHLTPNYINYLYKQETGETITDAILKLRMEVAKDMLADVRNRVYEISEAVGFNNTAYFCSVFKKYAGATPKEYRERQVL